MAVLAFRRAEAMPEPPIAVAPLARITGRQRDEVFRLEALLRPALEKVADGVPAKVAAKWLVATGADGLPSWKTVEAWINGYRKHGREALIDGRTGRKRTERGWEAQAADYYRMPTHPNAADIAHWLRTRHGHDGVTPEQVRAYLKTLPSHLAETSPRRLGAHFHDQNIRPHKMIEISSIAPGVEWEVDGHRCDVYVRHPRSGKHYRPELTVLIDKGSRRVVWWSLADNESAWNTLHTLSLAIRRNDHVPLFLHADPGSTRARMMSDEARGFLQRMGITPRFTRAGNARGKGLIERSFGITESRVGKLFPTYCGHCRTDDELSRLAMKIEAGRIALPEQQTYVVELAAWFDDWNNQYDDTRGGTPNELWANRQPRPMAHPEDAIARPADQRVVSHYRIRHQGRFYQARELAAYEGRDVLFEYDMDDDQQVWVFDLKHRFVCIAQLVERIAGIPASRIEQAERNSLAGKLRRLQAHADEAAARLHGPIDAAATVKGLEAFGAIELPQEKQAEGRQPLDLLSTDY